MSPSSGLKMEFIRKVAIPRRVYTVSTFRSTSSSSSSSSPPPP
jgi:hypothetical protein